MKIKSWAPDLEEEAKKQVENVSNLPFIFKHVAVMPDAHAGKGSTIGTVIASQGAICPSTVGVDIGCGMSGVKLPFTVDVLGGSEKLRQLRHSIERSIPTGKFANKNISQVVLDRFTSLGNISLFAEDNLRSDVLEKSVYSLGTLGGGNHFIEICKDENDGAWIVLHSGSRNIGKCLADIHINKAKDLMKQYFISLPDSDLAYVVKNTPEFNNYIHDLMWAQNYAKHNRDEMMNRALEQVYRHVYGNEEWKDKLNSSDLFKINCHHNYTSLENHFGKDVYVTRKGAVSAKEGEWGIIPGSMSTHTYIVKGLGNRDSFCSCSHGAGRKMSRTKARELYTQEDLVKTMEGIEARTDASLVDEISFAYKDVNEVMENQKDLVVPIYKLKQILNIKGD